MIFSTGMFISAAGECKCCYIFFIQNLETSPFFNHKFKYKSVLIKAYILTSTLQIDGNNWDFQWHCNQLCDVAGITFFGGVWVWPCIATQKIVWKERS